MISGSPHGRLVSGQPRQNNAGVVGCTHQCRRPGLARQEFQTLPATLKKVPETDVREMGLTLSQLCCLCQGPAYVSALPYGGMDVVSGSRHWIRGANPSLI